MSELTSRFATSQPRIDILKGLLTYRKRLSDIGLTDGHQWIDGSFVENVEVTRSAPPSDIDIVTFAKRPTLMGAVSWPALVSANSDVFDPRIAKNSYKCDAYFVDLGKNPINIVADTAYWFGLFSHQRTTSLWKGMLQVPLVSDDATARTML